MERSLLTQADFNWKLAQLRGYCPNRNLHERVGPALELGTCVAGRLVLEFLGIKSHWRNPPYELVPSEDKKGFDVRVTDYGLPIYPIANLDDSEKEILVNFIIRAHRISHMTRDNEPDRHKWTCLGVPIIEKMFLTYFYENKRASIPLE